VVEVDAIVVEVVADMVVGLGVEDGYVEAIVVVVAAGSIIEMVGRTSGSIGSKDMSSWVAFLHLPLL